VVGEITKPPENASSVTDVFSLLVVQKVLFIVSVYKLINRNARLSDGAPECIPIASWWCRGITQPLSPLRRTT